MFALVRFLNSSSLLVALGAAALTVESFSIYNTTIKWWIVAEVFLLTWTGYLFLRLEKDSSLYKLLICCTALSSILLLAFNGFHGWQVLLLGGFIVVFYNNPKQRIQPIAHRIPRQTPFIKPVAVGIAWALTTTLFPLWSLEHLYEKEMWVLVLYNFFFITALTICDDIRDMNKDSGSIQTLPLILGLRMSKAVIILHLILATWLFYQIDILPAGNLTIVFTIYIMVIVGMILWLKPERNSDLQALLIDGSILLRGILVSAIILLS